MTTVSTVSHPAFVERLGSKSEEVVHLNFNDLFDLLLQYFLQYLKQNARQNVNPVYLQQYFAITEHTITQLIHFLKNPTPVKKHVKFFDTKNSTLMTKKNWWLMTENDSVLKLKKVSQGETDLRYEELTDAAEILQDLKSALDYKGDPKTIDDLGLTCVVAYDLERYYIHKGSDYDFYVDVVLLEQKADGPTYYVIGCVRLKDPAARFTEQKLERLKVVQPVRSKLLQVVSAWHPGLFKQIEAAGFVYRQHFADQASTHHRAHPFSPEAQDRDFQLLQEYKQWLGKKTEEQRIFLSKTQDPEELFNCFKCSQMQPPESEDDIEYEDSDQEDLVPEKKQ